MVMTTRMNCQVRLANGARIFATGWLCQKIDASMRDSSPSPSTGLRLRFRSSRSTVPV
jgi:hypothetical protein